MVYDILFSRRFREDEQREIEFRDRDQSRFQREKKTLDAYFRFSLCVHVYARA